MRIIKTISIFWFFSALMSCTIISPYNEKAYEQATRIKAISLNLMEQAENPFNEHRNAVEGVLLEARMAYEYAKQRPNNEESTRQWAIMIDPNRNMLAGFFKKWKDEGKLKKLFIDEAKEEISDGFDTISALESGKEKEN